MTILAVKSDCIYIIDYILLFDIDKGVYIHTRRSKHRIYVMNILMIKM